MSNGFHRVKNLNLNNVRKATATDLTTGEDPQTFIIPTPVPLKNEQQIIQLRLHQDATTSTAGKIFYMFKQCRKQVNLKAKQPIVIY